MIDNTTISDKKIAKETLDFFIKNGDKMQAKAFLDHLTALFMQHRVFSLMDSEYASKK